MKMIRTVVMAVCLAALLSAPCLCASEQLNAALSRDGTEPGDRTLSCMAGEDVLLTVRFMPEAGSKHPALRIKWTDGLTAEERPVLYRAGEAVNSTLYTALTETEQKCASVHLSEPLLASMDPGEQLTVCVSLHVRGSGAELRSESVTASMEDGTGTVRQDSAAVTGGKLSVFRGVSVGEGTGKPVPGAAFSVRCSGSGEKIVFGILPGGRYEACTAVRCIHSSHVSQLRTATSGCIEMTGLPAGEYILCEERTPNGAGDPEREHRLTVSETGETVADGKRAQEGMLVLICDASESGQLHSEKRTDLYTVGIIVMLLLYLVAAMNHKRLIAAIEEY